jgi:hypothetical protein
MESPATAGPGSGRPGGGSEAVHQEVQQATGLGFMLGRMPFLDAIESPNRSIQRRIAAAGGSWPRSSRAPAVSRTTWSGQTAPTSDSRLD